MTRRFIGVRWWLGAAFAVVAATSTAIVVSQFSTRSENAFRNHAAALTATGAAEAATSVAAAAQHGNPATGLGRVARQLDLELHLYDRHGVRIAAASPEGKPVSAPDQEGAALQDALAGRRYNAGTSDGSVFVAGVPLRRAGLGASSCSARAPTSRRRSGP